jgi:hypothetical protein
MDSLQRVGPIFVLFKKFKKTIEKLAINCKRKKLPAYRCSIQPHFLGKFK